MSGLSDEEMNGWRCDFKDVFRDDAHVISPTDYFHPDDGASEREAFDFDLYWVRHCDVIIVNLNKLDSIGTAQEVMLAHSLNKPIIILCDEADWDKIHPWYKEEATRFFYWSDNVIMDVYEYTKMYE